MIELAKRKSPRRIRRYFSRKRRGIKDKRIPLLTTIPAVNAALIQPIFGGDAYGSSGAWAKKDNPEDALKEFANIISLNFTGYDIRQGKFSDFRGVINTYGSLILGYAGSKLANKMGVNTAMKRVPIVGKYIKL